MNKITKKILILIPVLLVFIVILSYSIKKIKASEDTVLSYSSEIKEEYAKGETFIVPTLQASNGLNKYSVTHTLIYPDKRESKYISNYLDIDGDYTLVYEYNDGEPHTITHRFNVYTSVASFFTSRQAEIKVKEHLNDAIDTNGTEYIGLGITTKKTGTVVEYTREIDLSDNTKDDTLIELIANPQTVNIIESSNITITLTDVMDETNFVKISLKQLDYEKSCYLLWAGANFEYGFSGYDPYNMIGINVGNTYSGNGGITAGYVAKTSTKTANGYGFAEGLEISSIKLAFDYQSKRIYCSPAGGEYVCDLDDTNVTGAGNEWKGFTNGKCKLTIESNLLSSQSSYIILNIDGVDFKNYKLIDTQAPTIDIPYIDKFGIPNGVVNKEYKIFDYYLTDNIDYFISDTDIKVYSPSNRRVDIISDKFIPKEVGTYTILYKAKDNAKNESLKEVKVEVLADYPLKFKITSVIPDKFYKIGETLVLDEIESIGAIGNIEKSINLYKNNELIAKDFETYKFMSSGEYILEYTLKDYLSTTVSLMVNVVVDTNPYPIFDLPYIPSSYILGNTYYLPKVYAMDYSMNPDGDKVLTKVKVNGILLNDDNEFIPTVDGINEIVYYAASLSDESKITTKDPIKVNVLKTSKSTYLSSFFETKNIEISLNDDDISFTTSSDVNHFSFIHFLSADDFYLQFNTICNPTNPNFESFDIYLMDSIDSSLKIKISIVMPKGEKGEALVDSKTSFIYVNDIYSGTINGSFFNKINQPFELKFENKTLSLIDKSSGKVITTIRKYLNGDTFNGFDSRSVYVSFSLSGVTENAEVRLSMLSNQPLNKSNTLDKKEPIIVLDSDLPNDIQIGLNEEFHLPSALSYDVLSVNPELKLKISNSDRKVIYDSTALNGYDFKALEYGTYSIMYYATDKIGRIVELPFTLKVVDNIKPVIEVDNLLSTITINSRYDLPDYKVYDNVSSNLYFSITLYYKDGSTKDITKDNFIKISSVGPVKIVYYAVDESGNSTMKIFNIKVVK